jgi:hypothetical protein
LSSSGEALLSEFPAVAEKQAPKVLVNCLGVEGVLSTRHAYELGVTLVKQMKRFSINPWIAVIGIAPAIDGFALEVAQNRGARTFLFAEVQKATDWLQGL